MADLIDQDTLTALLAENDFSEAQQALYPTLAATASRMVRKWCNRYFNRRASIDELYTVDPGQPLLLREFPVNSVDWVSTDPTAVLSIENVGGSVRRASVRLATTGDVDGGLVVTGLSLVRVSRGVKATDTITFGDADTVADVAAAVGALGNGWTAEADPDYEDRPASDLRAVQGALPAVGRTADLLIHVTDLAFDLEADTGVLRFEADQSDPWTSYRWGPSLDTSFDDQDIRGRADGVRVIYDAGFSTVPEDVAQACAETVADLLNGLATNQRLASESGDAYSYSLSNALRSAHLTTDVMGKLALYRSSRF